MKAILTITIILTSLLLISCHPDKVESEHKIFNEVKNADEIFGLFDLKRI